MSRADAPFTPNKITVGTIIVLFMILSAWVVRLEQRLALLEVHATDRASHMPLTEKLNIFVPRAEYSAKVSQRDQEFFELREAIKLLVAKTDRLAEQRRGGD